VRREVLPLLEDVLAGGVAESLARTAAQLRADADVLDALTPDTDEVSVLAALPAALRTRALKRWAQAVTPPLTAVHVAELDRLVTAWHGQGPVHLPGGYEAVRASGRLQVRPPAEG
jgi:tRNA(Ile)-lysidine synthase